MKKITLFLVLLNQLAFAYIINGYPAGDKFPAVGGISDVNFCTITKVGLKQFLTAAHCIDVNIELKKIYAFGKSLKVASAFVHPSWLKDCGWHQGCTGQEVGTKKMTPGRADIVLINVQDLTPNIPIMKINFNPVPTGSNVVMVGIGCTKNIKREPQPPGMIIFQAFEKRYAEAETVSSEYLKHEKSLYKNIYDITGLSGIITLGYSFDNNNSSLCPGDSGGPLAMKNNQGEWEIVGIATDYTFETTGNFSYTNIHTRIDDESYHNIGQWIRDNWQY